MDVDVKDKIKKLIDFAEQNPVTLQTMMEIMDGVASPAGSFAKFRIDILIGYRVVFTVEEHPGGWMKHISISINDAEKLPGFPAIDMILEEFGMGTLQNALEQKLVYLEETITPKAVNILQQYPEFLPVEF
jgi:hypothetical protein